MYIPNPFQVEDLKELQDFVLNHSFGPLISTVSGQHFCTHLPFYYDTNKNRLFGHMAANNPHCKGLEQDSSVLVIFSGPHAYVSPKWYSKNENVPTWNYSAVHVQGQLEFLTSNEELDQVLRLTTEHSEQQNGTQWSYESLPVTFKETLFKAIRAFQVNIVTIEGKYKMSQNRSPEDIRGVIEGLKEVGEEKAAALMARLNKCMEPSS